MLSDPIHHLQLQGVIRQGLEGTEQYHRLPQASGFGLDLSARKSLSFAHKFVQVTQDGLGVHDAQGAHQLPGKAQEDPAWAMAEAPSHPRREERALQDK